MVRERDDITNLVYETYIDTVQGYPYNIRLRIFIREGRLWLDNALLLKLRRLSLDECKELR